MKKSLLFAGTVVLALLLSGCGARPYVDVKSDDYATFQLIPKSKTMIFADDYYAFINDFSKGCKNYDSLGIVETDSDTPSRIVKIPVEKSLQFNVFYKIESPNSRYIEQTQFILTPEKNRHYIIEYMRKDVSFFEAISDFHVYMKEGEKKIKIPSSRLRKYDYSRDCR